MNLGKILKRVSLKSVSYLPTKETFRRVWVSENYSVCLGKKRHLCSVKWLRGAADMLTDVFFVSFELRSRS